LLPPGTYSVKFESSGFNATEVPSVTVNVTETAVLNQALTVGSQNQEVTVQAEAEAVQTSNATLGDVVGTTATIGLPLTTRNYTNLLGLSAGANAAVFNASNLGKGTTDIAVNGASLVQNDVQMDGVSISVGATNGQLADSANSPGIGVVNPDAVQEFKIQTSLFDAGYGRNPGANVNVVTKSGTNDFHGSAFEFFRNTDLNANDFFRNQSYIGTTPNNSRQVLNQNQFGGVVGGPIKKDKLFFFASFQATKQINGAAAQGFSSPTLVPLFPGGDRSNAAALEASVGAALCPSGPDGGLASYGAGPANSYTQLACNGSNINPAALAMLQAKNPDGTYLIPSSGPGVTAAKPGVSSGQNTTYSIPARFTEYQGLGNLDYVIDSKNTLSARFFSTSDYQLINFACGTCLPYSGETSQNFNTSGILKLTTILSPHLVNEARLSIQKLSSAFGIGGNLTAPEFGITPNVASIKGLPQMAITGLFTFGVPFNDPQTKWPSDWDAADELSWTHGKQTFRFGVEYERDRYNWNLPGLATGVLTFQTIQDFLLGLPGCAVPGSAACTTSTSAGLTNGSSLSNIANSGQYASVVPPGGLNHEYRTPYGAAYVQDDIKVTQQFTLNLGLRWEYDAFPYDTNGLTSDVWQSLINTVPIPGSTPATGTLAGFVVPSNWNFAANAAPPVGGLYQGSHKGFQQQNTPLTDFAPRLGFAWSPLSSSRLVVRGGTGYFYDRVGQGNFNQSITQGEPYATSDFASGAANYFSSLQVPYAPTSLQWTPRWVNFAAGATSVSSNIAEPQAEANARTPLVYEWNLFTQYEFLSNWTMEIGYVGSRGIHQYNGSMQANAAQLVGNPLGNNTLTAPGIASGLVTTNTVQNASLRVPFLGFAPAGMQTAGDDGDMKFNSFQGTLRKRFSHGFQAQAAYAYSRSFVTFLAGNTATYNNPDILVYQQNPSYHPQRLAISYLWNLPLGSHQGLLDKLTSGWAWSGVTVVQNGTPLTVTDSRGGAIYGLNGTGTIISTAQYAAGMGAANAASSGSVEQRLGGRNGGAGWFNPASFTTLPNVPTSNGTGWGDSSMGIVSGPGQFNWDMSLTKSTKVGGIREDAMLQFRTEFFNAFNHPQFSNPAVTDVSKGTFGQITSSSVNPRLIQFALKYIF